MSESPQKGASPLGALEKLVSSAATFISSISFIGMLAIVLASIVMRVFEIPFFWGEEAARYLMFTGVYIGMSVAVREKAHLGVDLFVNMLPSRHARGLKLFGLVVTTLVYVAITKVCWDFAARMARGKQISPALSIPMYIMYFIIFIGFALCIVESLFILRREIAAAPDASGQGETDGEGEGEGGEVHLI